MYVSQDVFVTIGPLHWHARVLRKGRAPSSTLLPALAAPGSTEVGQHTCLPDREWPLRAPGGRSIGEPLQSKQLEEGAGLKCFPVRTEALWHPPPPFYDTLAPVSRIQMQGKLITSASLICFSMSNLPVQAQLAFRNLAQRHRNASIRLVSLNSSRELSFGYLGTPDRWSCSLYDVTDAHSRILKVGRDPWKIFYQFFA